MRLHRVSFRFFFFFFAGGVRGWSGASHKEALLRLCSLLALCLLLGGGGGGGWWWFEFEVSPSPSFCLGMSPLILTVLTRDRNRGYYNL